jgi:hypothetical protein
MNKKSLSLVLLSLVFVSSLMFVSASFLEEAPKSQIIIEISDSFNLGSFWKEIIISLIVLLIIGAGIYNILELTSLFDIVWVKIIIAAGLGIISALTGWVSSFSVWALELAAAMGTIGIVLEIIIAIAIFIGLIFGSNWVARFAAKRKGQVAEIKAIKSSDEASAAITGLRRLQRNFEKKV